MITPSEIAKLKEACEKATDISPWDGAEKRFLANPHNTAFYILAYKYLPKLIEELSEHKKGTSGGTRLLMR